MWHPAVAGPPTLFELPGMPLPRGPVTAGTRPAATVGAGPAHPSDWVEAQVRNGDGLTRALRAARTIAPASSASPVLGAVQWFSTSFPPVAPGQHFDYRLALFRAGQLVATLPADGSWLPVDAAPSGPAAGAAATSLLAPPAPDRPRWAYDLTFFAALTVNLRAEVLGATPEGYRINFFVNDGTVRGPAIDAVVLPEGGDWMCIRPDGIGMVDICITYKTGGGALILERAGGVFDLGPDGYGAVAAGRFVGSPPFYATPSWETAHPDWQWLNRCQGFGIGRVVLDELQVRCDIYLPTVGGPVAAA